MAQTTLVTGGLGFIARHLVRALAKEGHNVIAVDNLSKRDVDGKTIDIPTFTESNVRVCRSDIFDLTSSDLRIDGVDTIFHLAAKIGGIKYFHKSPATILKANDLLTHRMLDLSVEAGVKRFVYTSSSMVFEQANVIPTPEDHIDKCPIPLSAYGFSKLAGEVACKAYQEEYGLEYVICRPFNAYGEGEMPEEEVGIAHVIPDLLKKVMGGQRPLEILGDGLQTRAYSYVTEVADGMKVTGLGNVVNTAFNIGSNKEATIREIAETVWKVVGREEPFELTHLPSYKYDVRRRCPDVSKMRSLYGWEAKIGLEEGITKTYAYLRGKGL